MKTRKSSSTRVTDFGQRGQMIVEYVLLLVVAIAIATMLRKILVNQSSDPESSGAVQQRWHQLTGAIGQDDPNIRNK